MYYFILCFSAGGVPPLRSVMVPGPSTSHNEAANMGFILVQEEASDPLPGAFLGASTGTARSK